MLTRRCTLYRPQTDGVPGYVPYETLCEERKQPLGGVAEIENVGLGQSRVTLRIWKNEPWKTVGQGWQVEYNGTVYDVVDAVPYGNGFNQPFVDLQCEVGRVS